MITLKAPAKINLFLKIFNRRDDGYHHIVSLLQMVGLYDILTFKERPSGIHFDVSGMPYDRSNLAMAAAELLQKEVDADAVKGAAISLTKHIPISAGLGGGSSDAAATLIGLNRLWSLRWPKERLAKIGAKLGSDVPFFFYGPTAWVSGRGEIVEPIDPVLQGWTVLVNPGLSISTAWAYEQFSKMELTKKGSDITMTSFNYKRPTLEKLIGKPCNDLEKATLVAIPSLKAIKRDLGALGGEGVLMSGSGSTLFALFDTYDLAKKAALEIRKKRGGQAWVAKVLRRTPF